MRCVSNLKTASPRSLTYAEALEETSRIANALRDLGVDHGDRVVIYMPLGIEGVLTMQACARIGAVHSVVYAGMGPDALRQRIDDSGAAVVVAGDVHVSGAAKSSSYFRSVRTAVAAAPGVDTVLVHRRRPDDWPLEDGEVDFEESVSAAENECDAEEMDAEDPCFILYTSGTTGKTQRRGACARRVHGRRASVDAPLLRYSGGRRLVVHVRHRMDRRSQLHRLRPRCWPDAPR